MTVRVVALGQSSAGDDGVGLRVLERLSADPPAGVELHGVADTAQLVDLILGADHLVIVDAATGAGPAGSVHVFDGASLGEIPQRSLSSHGMSVSQALELGRALGGGSASEVHVVAIAIEPPSGFSSELCPAVAAAVPVALERVRRLLGV